MRELEARVESQLEGERDTSRAEEVWALRDRSAAEASRERMGEPGGSIGAKDVKLEEHRSEVDALQAELGEGAGRTDVKSRDLSLETARYLSLEITSNFSLQIAIDL